MPKTTRDGLKHNAARSIKHGITIVEYLNEMIEIFSPTHPEQAEQLQVILSINLDSIDALSAFLDATWGIDKDNIHKWF